MRWLRKSNGSRNIFQEPELIKISPIDAGSDFIDLSLPCAANNPQLLEVTQATRDSHSEGEDDDSQRRSFTEFLQLQSGQGNI